MSRAPQASLFPIKIPSKFQAFSNTPSWTSFFRLLELPGSKMLDFWTPLAPGGSSNGAQNRPSGVKRASFSQRWSRLFADLFPRSLSERSWVPLWSIWMDFRWIFDEFGWILASFFYDFGHVSAAASTECQRRLARNDITENVKNMKITAEICKSQTQPKTH